MIGALRGFAVRAATDSLSPLEETRDPLTQLPDRPLLLGRLDQALSRTDASGPVVGLVLIQLDGLPMVDNEAGRSVGDAVLVETAQRLCCRVRGADTVARFSADIFAVMLSDLPTTLDVVARAIDLQRAFAEPYSVEGYDVVISGSAGIAVGGGSNATADLMVRDATTALSKSHADGIGRCTLFEPAMANHEAERIRLESDLRSAAANGEIEVHYQPIIDLRSGRVVSMEALARWRHPRLGYVPPSTFIPIAEENGTMRTLGEYVMRKACRQAAQWLATYGPQAAPSITVNVSVVQLREASFASEVQRILRETGLPASRLEIEITESTMMRDIEHKIEILKDVRDLGVRTAVDDFGTGYSCMAYLTQLPIDTVKLDHAFVKALSDKGKSWTIARAIVDLAHSLEMRVVAEGIETPGQLSELRSFGADCGQGFIWAKSLEPDAAEAFFVDAARVQSSQLAAVA